MMGCQPASGFGVPNLRRDKPLSARDPACDPLHRLGHVGT